MLNKITSVEQTASGASYLKAIIKNIAEILNVKYVFVGHPVDGNDSQVETDVVWAGNDYHDNFIYDLKNTPCENVLTGSRVCLYDDVTRLFPDDDLLKEMGVCSYVGAPTVNGDGRLTGLLVLLDDKEIEDKAFYSSIVEFLAIRVQAELDKFDVEKYLQTQVVERTVELQESNRSLESAVSKLEIYRELLESKVRTDSLTGVGSREYFYDSAESQMLLSKRYDQDVSVLFVDLDLFKGVNDKYGHLVGDGVIKEAANRLRVCVRETDILARYGGDEFVLFSPCSDEQAVFDLAGRVLDTFSSSPINVDGHEIPLTVSVGISSGKGDSYTLERLMWEADSALYRSKDQGRNSCGIY
ncbi:diguanylate cyclase [Pseudomonadota bacterium]